MKRIFFLLIVIAGLWACSKDEDDREVILTIDNLTGAWEVVSYRLDGENAFEPEYEDDYIYVQANKEFTARFSLLNEYYHGDISILGNDIKLGAKEETIELTMDRLTKSTLVVESNYNGKICTQKFRKVKNPTTYQVKNNMSSDKGIVNLISYYVDNENGFKLMYGNVHGMALAGEACGQKMFTRYPDKMHIGCNVLIGFVVKKYVSVYPQQMEIGRHNILSLSDTTMVLEASSDSRVVVKPMRIKDILGE